MPYFSKSALNLAKEVVVRYLRRLVINIVDGKTQLLHLLKVVIKFKSMRELWTQAVLHILCPPKLCKQYPATVKQN